MRGSGVGENVAVGASAVRVCDAMLFVAVLAGVEEGFGVVVNVGDDVIVSVGVIVGVSGGFIREMKINAKSMIRPIMDGIPYLKKAGGNGFLYGVTSGAFPLNPRGDRRFLKLSSYSPVAKLTKLIVLRAKGTGVGTSMIGMIFLRKFNA